MDGSEKLEFKVEHRVTAVQIDFDTHIEVYFQNYGMKYYYNQTEIIINGLEEVLEARSISKEDYILFKHAIKIPHGIFWLKNIENGYILSFKDECIFSLIYRSF